MGPGWIVRRGDVESQPLSFDRLTAYADSRRLRRSDRVRREDEAEWRKAEEIPGLFISKLRSRLATLAVAAAFSITLNAIVKAIGPQLWLGGFHGLVYGFWYSGFLLGYDPSGYGGLMGIAALGSRTGHWMPWIWFYQAPPGLIWFVFVPIWVAGTVLLSIPGLLRPRRYSPAAVMKFAARCIRLEPGR